MKKITLLVAALAIVFNASAQWGNGGTLGDAGNYDLTTDTWINAVPAANQPFTFAIHVTNADAIAWLEGEAGRTIALADFRLRNVDGSQRFAIRLAKVTTSAKSHLYAIDMSIAQIFTGETAFIQGLSTTAYPFFELTGASVVNSTWVWNAYGGGSIGYDPINPVYNDAMALEGFGVDGVFFNAQGTAAPGTINGGGASVPKTFADKGEPVSVEYFSLLGAKLPATATGLVIAKYTFADGSAAATKLLK